MVAGGQRQVGLTGGESDESVVDGAACDADRSEDGWDGRSSIRIEESGALRRGRGDLSDEEVQTVGRRITEHLHAEIQRILADIEFPQDVTVDLAGIGRATSRSHDPAYRPLAERGAFTLRLGSRRAHAPVESEIAVGFAEEREARFTFCVVEHVVGDESRATPPMRLRLSDVYPESSRVAVERMAAWCTSLIGGRLGEIAHQPEMSLRSAGVAQPRHDDA